jgi:hypothetical protein
MTEDVQKEIKLTAELRESSVPYPTLIPEANATTKELELRKSWMGDGVTD